MAVEAGDVSGAVDRFLAHAAVERGLSPRTIDAYARDLARFADYLESRGVRRIADVERRHMSGFAQSLERHALGGRSRVRALVAVRRLLRHFGTLGALREDPTEGIVNPGYERPLPRILRPDESILLIEAAGTEVPLGIRDRAMLEVLYGAGLRVSELVALCLSGVERRAVCSASWARAARSVSYRSATRPSSRSTGISKRGARCCRERAGGLPMRCSCPEGAWR